MFTESLLGILRWFSWLPPLRRWRRSLQIKQLRQTADDASPWVPVDPYPLLPVMAWEELRDGDVLMMMGEGCANIPYIPFPVPVSWIIWKLDGGGYSHSAPVTIIDGQPMVWDHSSEGMLLAPVTLDEALKEHAWCHVYRLEKDGQQVDSERFPPQPLVKVLEDHRKDQYDMFLLVMAGVAAVISRRPEDERVRAFLRRLLNLVIELLEELLKDRDIRKGMLVCTGVTALTYWEAINKVAHDYAIDVDLQRRRELGADGSETDPDPAWDRMVNDMKAVLSKIWGDFDTELASYKHSIWGMNADWVPAGSDGLPANLVSPSDLQFSRSFVRAGKLEVPD